MSDRLDSSSLVLQPFPDVRFELQGIETRSVGANSFNLAGSLSDDPNNKVVISIKDGRAYGIIRRDDKIYEIRSTADDQQIVVEIDAAALEALDSRNDATLPEVLQPAPEDQPGEFDPDDANEGDSSDAGDTDLVPRGRIINVLVGYTNDAERAASDIELIAQNAVAVTNQSYEDSDVYQRLHLVRVVDLNYEENGAGARTLRDRIRNPSDGHMDQIHGIRNESYADIVAVLGTPSDFCGFAYIMGSVSHDFNASAFSITAQRCAVGNLSFAHELGHNMGGRHNWEADNTNGSLFSFNHGFRDSAASRRTIMSLPSGCASCGRIGRWSDPGASIGGRPLGAPLTGSQPADNHRTLNDTAATVSRFRQLGLNESVDLYGSSFAAGDFDDDGFVDLAIGAPGESPGGDPKSGYVFLYRGTPYGLAPWTGISQAGLGSNEIGDRFGAALAAGDFDGDGKDDLAVGAPGESPGSDPKSGWVFLFRGSNNGVIPWQGFGQSGLGSNEQEDLFGASLAAGDFDGDGRQDLAVGAPGESPSSEPKSGWVFVFRGTAEGVSPWQGIGQAGLGNNESEDRFGAALAASDFDNDGKDDLAVGAPGEAPGSSPKSGWMFVFRGNTTEMTPWQGFGQEGLGADELDDKFGSALAVGDFDGDGTQDLAIGAPAESPGNEPKSGWAFIFRGGSSVMSPWVGFGQANLGSNEQDDRFGAALASGDFNGNGVDDLVVGAPGESPGSEPKSGWAFAYRGSSTGMSPLKGFGQAGLGVNELGDGFGMALAPGDFDADGMDDLTVGAPGESPGTDPRSGYAFGFRGENNLAPWFGLDQEL